VKNALILRTAKSIGLVAMLIMLCNTTAQAKSRPDLPKTTDAPSVKPLILEPSDEWEQRQLGNKSSTSVLLQDKTRADLNVAAEKRAQRKLNVGCDVDMRQQTLLSTNLAGQFIGECRLGLAY
jgi:hypothetical protein